MIATQTNRLQRDGMLTIATTGASLLALGFLLSRWQTDSTTSLAPMLTLLLAALWGAGLAIARMRRNMWGADALMNRLQLFNQSSDPAVLTPIFDSGAISHGWNRIIAELGKQQLDQAVERRMASAAGNRGAERFARALRSLSDGLAISDRQGKLNYVNPACQSLVGGPVDSDSTLEGQLLSSLLAAADFANWTQVGPDVLEGTRPARWELRRGQSTSDGVLQISRIPLEGRAHEIDGFVWTLRDVTQTALAHQAHEQFLAAASHELRTPLTNIKAYSESLIDMKDIPPSEQRQFFNVIHSEAERLSRLLNQLLDIQQLEAGSMTVKVANFDIQRMLHEVQTQIQPLVDDHRLRLTCRIAPDIKTIQADKEKVISCLLNLLGNAIKYTPSGGEVRLIAEQLESAVSISVEDTGIGIAEQDLSKIFDRFYRCQDERVADIEGNGLGLSFAMEIARLHHGELRVESQLDKGSRFTLRLPLGSHG